MTPDSMFKWFWLVGLAVTAVNAAFYRFRANLDLRDHPERAAGYRSLIRGFVIWTGLPWVMLGAIILCGGIDNGLEIAQTNRIWAILWQAMIALIYLLTLRWIFLKGGAETLLRHPAMLGRGLNQVWLIKLFTLLMIAGGTVALVMIWMGKIPALPRAS